MENDLDSEDNVMSCLVAIGRPQPIIELEDTPMRPQTKIEFSTRHAADGNIVFVDPRATLLFGYLTQELIGSSIYEHIYYDDIPLFVDCHRKVLRSRLEVLSPCYRLKSKEGKIFSVETKLKQFINPRTKELEFIVCKHNVVIVDLKHGDYGPNIDTNLYQSSHQEYKGELPVIAFQNVKCTLFLPH